MTRTLIPGLLSASLAWTVSPGPAAAAQAPAQTPGPATAQAGRGRMGMMAERAEDMAAADKRLDELMRALQSATGPAKVDSLAAVVAELVAQHKAMHGRMARMGGMMMPPASPAATAAPAPPAGAEPHKH